jgi:molybdenum cofactor synthesis domain-containing protein
VGEVSYRAVVVTVSDRSAAGERADAAGPVAVDALRSAGFACDDARVVPDGVDAVANAIRAALAEGARLVVTTGGTGVGPRDATPEGTAAVLTRELPGIPEQLRRIGAAEAPGGLLSRGLAGVVDAGELSPQGALVVNLPGSPRAVASGMPVVLGVARHVIDQLGGGDHA